MIAGFVTGSKIEDLLLQDGPDGCNPKGPLVERLRGHCRRCTWRT